MENPTPIQPGSWAPPGMIHVLTFPQSTSQLRGMKFDPCHIVGSEWTCGQQKCPGLFHMNSFPLCYIQAFNLLYLHVIFDKLF